MRIKKPNKDAIRLSKFVNDWSNVYGPNLCGHKNHTLRSYLKSLRLFLDYMEEIGVGITNFSFDKMSRVNIENWIIKLRDKNSASTCNTRLSGVRTFLRYMAAKDMALSYISQNASLIPLQKAPKKKISGLTKKAVQSIMKMPNPTTETGLRDFTLMTVMYATAMRLNEVLTLTLDRINLDGDIPSVTIIGKGDLVRTVPLLPKTVECLRYYIGVFHMGNSQSADLLFFSKIGGKNRSLSQTAVDKRLKKYAKKAHEICEDVPLTLHSHQFRHAMASHWLEDGINIVQISSLLGHSNVETTMIYLDITTDDERKALMTIEDGQDCEIEKKWKKDADTLTGICGLCKAR